MNIEKPDISEIEEGLYLSSREVAHAENILKRFAITHILTIDTWPLRKELYKRPENYVFYYLCKNDEESVDLLSHFEECNRIIKNGKNVLVHCFVGVSRSATIVLAYLMNKYLINYEEALKRVQCIRPVAPNEGFVHQLKLYEKMDYKIDYGNLNYQLLMLSSIASDVGCSLGLQNLPEESKTKIFSILPEETMNVFCRHCRYPLTSSKRIISHLQKESVTWRTLSVATQCKPEQQTTPNLCTQEIFSLPSKFLMKQCHGIAGKLLCPKCTRKVGRFSWLGIICDCGAKMRPGFALSSSRIDQTAGILKLEGVGLPLT